LETKDDPDATGNWVFFQCTKHNQSMVCDVFQTLISHELRLEDRDSDIEKQMISVEEFRDAFNCERVAQYKTAAMQSIKTGKGVDGRVVNVKEVQDGMAFMNAVAEACANTTLAGCVQSLSLFQGRCSSIAKLGWSHFLY